MSANFPPSSDPPSEGGPDRRKTIALAASIIAVLVIAIVFLLFDNYGEDRQKPESTTRPNQSVQLRAQLEKEYNRALSRLEEVRPESAGLEALIYKQKEQLREQKERIERLIGGSGDPARAEEEMRQLSAKADQYLAQIARFRAENRQASDIDEPLKEGRHLLDRQAETQRDSNRALSRAQAELIDKDREQEEQATQFDRMVDIASVINLREVQVTGLEERPGGKEVSRNRADRIDKLRVCFTTETNRIAEAGMEHFFLRIINPRGETLATEKSGSGLIINRATGQQLLYTKAAEIAYRQESETYCIEWPADRTLPQGRYELEIYNKGHVAGTGSFELN
ncbi:MAG: hypothetical protein R3350_02235 [Saprospiraceae bacterium]|nr:hypothetical protein [Saprospiraceae bacterium]